MQNLPVPVYQSVLTMPPYVGGASSVEGVAKIYKLSSNENAFGVNPVVAEACRNAVDSMFRYPEGGSVLLRRAIGEAHGLNPDQIVCSNGSDELIGLLCHAYLGAGDEAIVTKHGFLMYRLCTIGCGAQPVTVPETDNRVDVDSILKAVNRKTKIIFITNPGNPTGTYLSRNEIERLCKKLPDNIVVVLDSAYAEYVAEKDYSAGESLVDEFPNVIMLRTFSKIYGLGGLRLGWCYAADYMIDLFNRLRSPFNVNAMAQAAGIAAVGDRAFVKKCFDHNQKWLKRLPKDLVAIGLTMTPSVTNFVLVHFPSDSQKTAAQADAFLKTKGVIVRAVTAYGFPNSLRVTIGNDEAMNAFLSGLNEFMQTP